MLPLAILVLALPKAPPEVAPFPRAQPLTSVHEVRSLSVEQAVSHLPVQLTGVITYSGGASVRDFFLQDASGGVYVHPHDAAASLREGDRVTVTGTSDAGSFAPCVTAERIEKQGTAPRPGPLPFTMAPEDARWLDAQYVQCWGVVDDVQSTDTFTHIFLYNANGRVRLCVPIANQGEVLKGLINNAVTVKGVCVPRFDGQTRTIKTEFTNLYSNNIPMMPLVSSAPKAVQTIDHLFRFSPEAHPGARRVQIQGTVVGTTPFGEVYIQDPTGGVATRPRTRTAFREGQSVRSTGLIAIENRRITMLYADLAVIGEAPIPQAVPIPLAQLSRGVGFGTRVRVQGRIDDTTVRDNRLLLTLVDGPARLEVVLPPETELPPAASRVDVTGVLGRNDPNLGSGAFVVWCQNGGSLQVLSVPAPSSSWTTSRILALVAVPLLLAIVALAWVITLRRALNRQTIELGRQFAMQADLVEKLRTSQKLEAIGRLAGGIAHDFNNLLTVINGCGELLTNELPPQSPQRDLARDIRHAGERAASLVSQLLLFSRRQSVRLHPLDLRSTIREAERMLKRVIGETIRVECTLANDLPQVRAEPTLIHQIVLNLAVNARDAMPVGGTLSISVKPTESNGKPVVRLTVRDTGTGMDDATRARIFEPFFTTKGVGAGTGLGLATVYGIVQTLEGEIRCRSALGEGTTFEIDLPALNLPAASKVESSAQRTIAHGQGTVLVCEDDDSVRELIVHMLSTAGYDVLSAETANEAKRIAAEHTGDIRLLLTDLIMPEMNGLELAEQIQMHRPEMRVLFMSGYNEEDLIRQGYASQELHIIGKPFTATTLTARISERLSDSFQKVGRPVA